ncbi:hypothetical protein HF521_013080 [Silurus meridionalis]|uniref:Uncharacterized protein n=1 Tax=Silurus meridionalis TaxID=175797 RepID=A0A8T0AC50_SILME|nr:hypothetical protein HF521_013080 [Silurus meridionalis]
MRTGSRLLGVSAFQKSLGGIVSFSETPESGICDPWMQLQAAVIITLRCSARVLGENWRKNPVFTRAPAPSSLVITVLELQKLPEADESIVSARCRLTHALRYEERKEETLITERASMVRLQVCVLALCAALCLCSGGRGAERDRERERMEDEEDADDGASRSCRDVQQALVERGFTSIRINQHQTADFGFLPKHKYHILIRAGIHQRRFTARCPP